jgi:hypothetical protein
MTGRKRPSAQIIADMDKCKRRIAKERDKLKALGEEIESMVDDDDRAVDALEEAIEALKEL